MSEPSNVESMLWTTVNAYRARLLDADQWEEFVDFERYLIENGFRDVEKKFFRGDGTDE